MIGELAGQGWIVWTPVPGIPKAIPSGPRLGIRHVDRRPEGAGGRRPGLGRPRGRGRSRAGVTGRIDDEGRVRGGDRECFDGLRGRLPRVGLDVGHVDAAVSVRVDPEGDAAASPVSLALDPGQLGLRDVLSRELAITRNVSHSELPQERPNDSRLAPSAPGGRCATSRLGQLSLACGLRAATLIHPARRACYPSGETRGDPRVGARHGCARARKPPELRECATARCSERRTTRSGTSTNRS